MKTLKTAFTFAMVALMAQNSYADQITTILHTKGSDPSLHTDSSRPVIKSTLTGGRYYFEKCKENVQFDNNNLIANSSIGDCKVIGVKEGYSVSQIEKRIKEVDKKVQKEKLYDVISVTAGFIAGAGIGTIPAVRSTRNLVGEVGLSESIARSSRLTTQGIKDIKKRPSLIDGWADKVELNNFHLSKNLESFYEKYMFSTKFGAATGGLAGGAVAHSLVWGADEESVLNALKEATGKENSELNTISVELDGVDIAEISRELNVLLAGIYEE